DVERSALTHPMTKEIKPEAGIAQIDQMRARIGQRDDSGLVFDQWLDPVVDGIKEAAYEAGVEVLLEPEIESTSSGSRPASRALSAIVRAAKPAFSGFTGAATVTRSQVPWNTVPGLRLRRSAQTASRKLGSQNTV